jgi:hypothetical protein
MKKLNKLQINPERLLKSEDLLVLRGGYDGTCYECDDCDHVELGTIYGSGLSQYEAVLACQKSYPATCYAQERSCN